MSATEKELETDRQTDRETYRHFSLVLLVVLIVLAIVAVVSIILYNKKSGNRCCRRNHKVQKELEKDKNGNNLAINDLRAKRGNQSRQKPLMHFKQDSSGKVKIDMILK